MKLQPLLFALLIILLNLGGAYGLPASAPERQELVSLCYHSVLLGKAEYTVRGKMPILLTTLTNHFDWLKYNNYTPVSLNDVIAADKGLKKLPPKAILLTFDDGYKDFYTVVFPLLKAYNYPAVFALNTKWLATPAGAPVKYAEFLLDRDDFITWAQARELAQSGLVELASHSHNLHETTQANPQGSLQPKGVTLTYYPDKNRYQTPQEYYTEIYNDLKGSADLIAKHTGFRPRMMVWPYGLSTAIGIKAAEDAGLSYSSVLDVGYTYLNEKPGNTIIQRYLLDGQDHNLGAHLRDLRSDNSRPRERVIQVALDSLYDPDPKIVEQNVSKLLDRLHALKVSTVYLQAYADTNGNGLADALYFPNRHLPMRSDLFSWVAWQLHNRLSLQVYAWMPVLGFELSDPSLYIQAAAPQKLGNIHPVLSPFNPKARTIIKEIYSDLAAHSSFSGIFFHHDAMLGEYEDTSPAGLAWLIQNGFPSSLSSVHNDPELLQRVGRAKTKALTAFTVELTNEIRNWRREHLSTARSIYPELVLTPQAEARFAQNFSDFLDTYTHTVIVTMPFKESIENHQKWMNSLVEAALKYPKAPSKAIFVLQTVDSAKNGILINDEILIEQMRQLQLRGIRNIGYFPDNFAKNHPNIQKIHRIFSLQTPFTP